MAMVVLEVTLGSKAGSAEVLVRKMQKLSKSTLQMNREGEFPFIPEMATKTERYHLNKRTLCL